MNTMLDRPVWSALASAHAALAVGGAVARRYPRSTLPFLAACDDAPESLAALVPLVEQGERCVVVQANAALTPPGLARVVEADVAQMIAETVPPADRIDDIEPLGWGDAEDMLALAAMTRPGPFTLEALRLGRFWGIRIGGQLAAMAGERFCLPGWRELSGVCTHPDHRGKGLARRLSQHVSGKILTAGERPFLHAFASNRPAISLYESIGFALRSPMQVVFVERAD